MPPPELDVEERGAIAEEVDTRPPLPTPAGSETTSHEALNKRDAVPGPLEEPSAGSHSEEAPLRPGGAASHLGGLALCGSSSASRCERTSGSGSCARADPHEI